MRQLSAGTLMRQQRFVTLTLMANQCQQSGNSSTRDLRDSTVDLVKILKNAQSTLERFSARSCGFLTEDRTTVRHL